jgi:hypothetical protein
LRVLALLRAAWRCCRLVPCFDRHSACSLPLLPSVYLINFHACSLALLPAADDSAVSGTLHIPRHCCHLRAYLSSLRVAWRCCRLFDPADDPACVPYQPSCVQLGAAAGWCATGLTQTLLMFDQPSADGTTLLLLRVVALLRAAWRCCRLFDPADVPAYSSHCCHLCAALTSLRIFVPCHFSCVQPGAAACWCAAARACCCAAPDGQRQPHLRHVRQLRRLRGSSTGGIRGTAGVQCQYDMQKEACALSILYPLFVCGGIHPLPACLE